MMFIAVVVDVTDPTSADAVAAGVVAAAVEAATIVVFACVGSAAAAATIVGIDGGPADADAAGVAVGDDNSCWCHR